MSMAIAMTVLDGAILVADGRVETAFSHGPVKVTDDVDKLEPLTDSIFAIRFGIDHVAASAIKTLRTRLANNRNCRAKTLFASLEFHVRNEWQNFLGHLPADIDLDALGVGVICGGLASGMPFLASAVHHVIIPNPLRVLREGPGRIYVMGFQDKDEREQFHQNIESISRNTPWESHRGPLNSYVERLLQTSGAAIRSVESQTADSGGVIRYVVVRKEFPVEKAIWKAGRGDSMSSSEGGNK